MRLQNYLSIHSFLDTNQQAIKKNNIKQSFKNWGDLFKIEFFIQVTKIPTHVWTNVFHFTAQGNGHKYGDRIPAFWINRQGYFHICSAVNGNANYCKNFNFKLQKFYQVTIQQVNEFGKCWYEIVIDGVSILKIENKQAKRFSSVRLYASDPWYHPFRNNLGRISIIKVKQGTG